MMLNENHEKRDIVGQIALFASTGLLFVLTAFLVIAAVSSSRVVAAAAEVQKQFLEQCAQMGYALHPNSPYANVDLDVEELIGEYHERTNSTFNEYIEKMVAKQSSFASTNASDPDAIPPEGGVCTANNYSTFCVSQRMLMGKTATAGSEECKANPALMIDSKGGQCYNGEGYMEYSKSLACRKRATALRVSGESGLFLGTTCLGFAPILAYAPGSDGASASLQSLTQSQLALHMSTCLEGIEREISSSKRALDVTLQAYDELKTAWPMHKRYTEVYESLLKFRDKMVEIRHHTEAYPSKFIDATTTQCT